MTSDAILWTYALAPDVEVYADYGGALLRTPTSQIWIDAAGELKVLELLAGLGSSEAQIHDQLQQGQSDSGSCARGAALLFRLDRRGFLAGSLSSRGRQLASCIPLRPPPEVPLECPLEVPLRLSPRALARLEGKVVSLEAPGSWARIAIHDRNLLPLLHDLAVGRSAAEMACAAVGHCKQTILAVLALMNWCGLLDTTEEGWSGHDLLFHARTRRGYARVSLGKTDPGGEMAVQSAPRTTADGRRRLALERPDLSRLLAEDPPYALVSERRQSLRRQGSVALTSEQLSEFLFRTLHERGDGVLTRAGAPAIR